MAALPTDTELMTRMFKERGLLMWEVFRSALKDEAFDPYTTSARAQLALPREVREWCLKQLDPPKSYSS